MERWVLGTRSRSTSLPETRFHATRPIVATTTIRRRRSARPRHCTAGYRKQARSKRCQTPDCACGGVSGLRALGLEDIASESRRRTNLEAALQRILPTSTATTRTIPTRRRMRVLTQVRQVLKTRGNCDCATDGCRRRSRSPRLSSSIRLALTGTSSSILPLLDGIRRPWLSTLTSSISAGLVKRSRQRCVEAGCGTAVAR